MTATAAKPRKPSLRIVPPASIEELDRILTETAQHMAPMVSRMGSAREKAAAAIKVLDGERAGVEARKELAQRHHDALMTGFDAELADIDGETAMHQAALSAPIPA